MKTAIIFLLVILLVTVAPGLSEAGQFKITDIFFEVQPSTLAAQTSSVMVGARARYEGPVDLNDDNNRLWTRLYSGSDTFNNGTSVGGVLPTEGMVLHAIAEQHGANASLYHCFPNGLDRTYTGSAHVVIQHNWPPNETHEAYDGPGYLSCEPSFGDETPPGEEETAGGGGSTGEDPTDGGQGEISPILVDLDRGGFHLSSLVDGVRFDLDADGEPERVAWTMPDGGDAWLALDRNGNETIDSGRELFGNVTPQHETSKPNGYLALAMFDSSEQMGNEDGIIDTRDLIFSSLRLWIDENQDGVSQPWELWRLEEHQVRSIDLDYVTSRRRDRHGNEFRYSSLVRLEHGTTQAADVFVLVEE